MKKIVSAGGIVSFHNTILMLKKFNGDWVLPKGKAEEGETLEQTALREVFEETGVRAEIKDYLGEIEYAYKNSWNENLFAQKTVHWFLMAAKSMSCTPLRNEGFIEARFVHVDRVLELIRYEDEKEIVAKAIEHIASPEN
ncbi:MAG: NUDIX hydrolase [Clostridiales bacterium]|nr:MAG: NUDIX hydrolase [Clostridiales bacterium]